MASPNSTTYPYVAIVKYWMKMPNNARNHARNSHFPLRHVDFHLTHECLDPPHSPRQTTAQSLYALPHKDATKPPLFTMGRHKFTPKLPLPLRRSPPKSNTEPDPTHYPKRHPDPISHFATIPMCGQTDGIDDRSITLALCSALTDSDALILL